MPDDVLMITHEAPSVITVEILERVNRFVVKTRFLGKKKTIILAHLNNTGRLEQYLTCGKKAWLYPLPVPKKTTHRLFAVEDKSTKGAIVDTSYQMTIFENLVKTQSIPYLKEHQVIKRNARVGSSLIDYLLRPRGRAADGELYLEVKSAVYRDDGLAMYPDCPSIRGHKHVKELQHLSQSGIRTMILFIAALPDVIAFRPHSEADPVMARLLKSANDSGVELRAISFHFNPQAGNIVFDNLDLPVVLE